MRLAVLATALAAAFAAAPPLPDLPQQFSGKVQVTMPFFGTVPGTMYYDVSQNAQRIDTVFFGQTSIQLQLFDYPVEFQISNGMCQRADLKGDIPSYALPPQPFTKFVGYEAIGSKMCQHWSFSLVGQNDWWIAVDDTDPAKNVTTLVKYSVVAAGIKFAVVFNEQIPGPQDPALFDPKQWNCPAPVPPAVWTVSGYALDATTGRGISGAVVKLSDQTQTADSGGKFTFSSVTDGTYQISATADGYLAVPSRQVEVHGNIVAGTSADMALSPVLPAGSSRVVLKWGPVPRDLDSYVTTPWGCRVNYRARSCASGPASASLDVDRTSGYGPETVTITDPMNAGTYQHFVNIYTSGGSFVNSNAQVTVYTAGEPVVLAVPQDGPAGSVWWHTVNITNGAVTTVNKVLAPAA
eukprot:TRINITY_DN68891_c0_g1_i1.p1 TRINITY_DN68891_c0_g1~~TRINITY_DN68891_c0_g1_i1.p1  ORF type:complete len:409 (+),score=109.11 TRINITY_DN68891_c0_g1_i1:76-1302(+)